MKKNRLLGLLFLCFLPMSGSGQQDSIRNYDQELVDIIESEDCFRAMDYYAQYKDSLKSGFIASFYDFMLDVFFNRPGNAMEKIRETEEKYPEAKLMMPIFIMNHQITGYENDGDYSKPVRFCDKYLKFVQTTPEYAFQPAHAVNYFVTCKNLYSNLNGESVEQIIKKQLEVKDEIKIKCDINKLITFEAVCNGKKINAVFDTGVTEYILMEKSAADNLDVTYIASDTMMPFNNLPMSIRKGKINKLLIGDITFTDIPVIVFNDGFMVNIPDSVKNNPEEYERIKSCLAGWDIILGLPFIKSMGCVTLDQQNREITIKRPSDQLVADEQKNIFISKNRLYLQSHINGKRCLTFMDTGYHGGIGLYKNYWVNLNPIPVDENAQKEQLNLFRLVQTNTDFQYEMPVSLKIEIEDCVIDATHNSYLYRDVLGVNDKFDGIVGYQLFKDSKVTFDFVNMMLTVHD